MRPSHLRNTTVKFKLVTLRYLDQRQRKPIVWKIGPRSTTQKGGAGYGGKLAVWAGYADLELVRMPYEDNRSNVERRRRPEV